MAIRRRDFLKGAGLAAATIGLPRLARGADAASIYDLERFGNARILHITDTHAQLNPVYFREPSVNIGIGEMAGRPPHLVGRAFLERFGIRSDSADAYAFTCFEFEKSAGRFGKLGGFAHLKTLVDRLRADFGERRSLLVDGGDLWQGTGLANLMQGRDMVEVANLLGIEAMTGHWEFTYGEQALRDNLERFKGEFLAQNVFLTEEAAFNDAPAFDKATGRVFKPSVIKELRRVSHRNRRPGLSLHSDCASQEVYTGLELWHPRGGAAEACRCLARHRQGRRRRAAVAQRHGRGSQARQPGHRHRRHSRRPLP
ncbi:2',3'-cyclic-nucleotide 2'-phosphodiesterase (5'-nucleotidase family) [Bradyrhizobium yuanmingense]